MKNTKLKTASYVIAFVAIFGVINSCDKDKIESESNDDGTIEQPAGITAVAIQNQPIVSILSVANVVASADGVTYTLLFNQNAQVFTTTDATLILQCKTALANNAKLKVTFDPWKAQVIKVVPASQSEARYVTRKINSESGTPMRIDLATMSNDVIDNPSKISVINTTGPTLTNVVPDMPTAQAMFNYLTSQCCAVPGPYTVDYCISFQYAEDGCYARAHKMCYILNNKYHYATHKVFSFANAGSDVLSVQAQKWGGCCVNWWYHVAPLVNIKTPTGPKTYVFDPAMFDQPVLLSTWLHAQQNPACASTPHVSMINVQPTTSYSPADYTGYSFDTDPTYSSTNSTLISYAPLKTCP